MHRLSILPSALVLLIAGCNGSYERIDRNAPPAGSSATETPAQSSAAQDPHQGLTESEPAQELGPEVDVGAIHLTGPKGWIRKEPRNEFITAEFALPKAEGDDRDGRLTVSTALGSVEDNVARWRDQFGGKPEKESQQQTEVAGSKVTIVDFMGTYNDQASPFVPGVQRPGYHMLAAIIPIEGQLHFVKAYGPQKTMADHEDAFHTFLKSLKRK